MQVKVREPRPVFFALKIVVCEHNGLILVNNRALFHQNTKKVDTTYRFSSYLCIVKRKQEIFNRVSFKGKRLSLVKGEKEKV